MADEDPPPVKPLPDDRDVLLALFDEARGYIAAVEPLRDVGRKLAAAFRVVQAEPAGAAGMASHCAELRRQYDRLLSAPGPSVTLLRDYIPRGVKGRAVADVIAVLRAGQDPASTPHVAMWELPDPMLDEVRRIYREAAAKLEALARPDPPESPDEERDRYIRAECEKKSPLKQILASCNSRPGWNKLRGESSIRAIRDRPPR